MTQYVINIGAIPNDGTGDPLRTAFNETNLNFNQVFAAGPVLSNIQIANNKILTTNTNGNLVLAPNGTGVVQSNVSIVPNLANLRNLGSATNRWSTVYTQYLNATQINLTGDLTVTGNLTVQGNIIQIGNIVTDSLTIQLANTASNVSSANGAGITVGANDNIATVLYNSASNVWVTNIGISSVGNITAPYFIGNGSQLTGVVSSYGNANVVALLAGFGSNTVSTTGNITGNYFIGNGSQLTGLPAGYANANAVAYGESGWAGNIIPSGNAVYSLGNATNQWNDLYVSNSTIFMNNVPISLSAGNVLTVNGNAVLQNNSNSSISTTGNITSGNVLTGGIVSATGNVTGNYIFGNGSQLSGLSTSSISNGNSNVAIPTANGNATITANAASTWTFGTDSILTLPAGSSRITSYGQITIETDNNASGMYLNADGVNLLYANANVTLRANSTGTNKDWNFGNTGVLTLPNADATGFGNIYFEENSSTITFGLDDNATPYLYSFSTSGITLPKGGVVSEGAAPTGIGNTIAITPSGGSDANQQLLVYPTGNIVEGNHLHLTTGDLYNTELFLGNDNLYVKLANSGNIVINSNDSAGNAGQWNFDTTGNLTLPGNIIAINYADGNRVTGGVTFNGEAVIGTGTSNTQSGLYLAPDPVSLTNDLYLRVRGNIIDEPTHIHFDTGNNQYYNQYIGDDNKYILLANTGNVVVNTNDNAGNSAQWIFNNFGTLSLPGGSRLSPLGANLDIIAGTGSYVNLITADESSSMGVDNGGGYVTTAGGTWDFGTTGNLTAPGNVSAVGNVTAGNISAGSGTITGGNVNGANFNGNVAFGTGTVGGSGNITGGNILTAGIVSATGNVSGNFFIGNGSQLTGIAASYGNANVATFLAAYGSNTVSTTGNITAGNLIGNISITGNVQGTSANVTLVAGAYSWTFDNTGNTQGDLSLTGSNITINNAPGGNEGAEIRWALPSAANTVLNTSLIQDVFQNGMRFFEGGGNSRGLYMDLGNVPNGAGTAVGYRDVPQVSFTGNATLAATDAGRHYYSTLATANTLTIANNTSVSWVVGTAISIVNRGSGNIIIAQGSGVSLYLAGNATASNRTVTTYGMATLLNVAANVWMINGSGVS
jgi:hypothetical protein